MSSSNDMSSHVRLRKQDYSVQEWTEIDRAREREYDAKRRARKKEELKTTTLDERRRVREQSRKVIKELDLEH